MLSDARQYVVTNFSENSKIAAIKWLREWSVDHTDLFNEEELNEGRFLTLLAAKRLVEDWFFFSQIGIDFQKEPQPYFAFYQDKKVVKAMLQDRSFHEQELDEHTTLLVANHPEEGKSNIVGIICKIR